LLSDIPEDITVTVLSIYYIIYFITKPDEGHTLFNSLEATLSPVPSSRLIFVNKVHVQYKKKCTPGRPPSLTWCATVDTVHNSKHHHNKGLISLEYFSFKIINNSAKPVQVPVYERGYFF